MRYHRLEERNTFTILKSEYYISGRRIVPAIPLRSQNRRIKKENDGSNSPPKSVHHCNERLQNGDGGRRGLLPKDERGKLSTSIWSTSQVGHTILFDSRGELGGGVGNRGWRKLRSTGLVL